MVLKKSVGGSASSKLLATLLDENWVESFMASFVFLAPYREVMELAVWNKIAGNVVNRLFCRFLLEERVISINRQARSPTLELTNSQG